MGPVQQGIQKPGQSFRVPGPFVFCLCVRLVVADLRTGEVDDDHVGRPAAIIDSQTWEATEHVRALRGKRRDSQKHNNRVYPLTGLATCADCGSP